MFIASAPGPKIIKFVVPQFLTDQLQKSFPDYWLMNQNLIIWSKILETKSPDNNNTKTLRFDDLFELVEQHDDDDDDVVERVTKCRTKKSGQ